MLSVLMPGTSMGLVPGAVGLVDDEWLGVGEAVVMAALW